MLKHVSGLYAAETAFKRIVKPGHHDLLIAGRRNRPRSSHIILSRLLRFEATHVGEPARAGQPWKIVSDPVAQALGTDLIEFTSHPDRQTPAA